MKKWITLINKITGSLLIVLTTLVAIPLVIKTLQAGEGTWGFAIVGMPILLPLCAYFLFGITGCIVNQETRKTWFIISHGITLVIGLATIIVFPVYPILLVVIPVLLAFFGIRSRDNFDYYLLVMILLATFANLLLLKWEIDFDRTIPLFQLFSEM